MARMKRCLAQLSLRVKGQEEHFWPGLEVNFDRVLIPEGPGQHAYTVADAVAGREDCFEDVVPVHDAIPAVKPAPSAPSDEEKR